MSLRLQWRNKTPKGVPARVEWKDGLTTDDVIALLPGILGHCCWLYVQDDAVDFRGNSLKKEKKK